MSKQKVVLGIVSGEVQAENIVQQLQGSGFETADISVIFPDKHGTKDFAHEHNTKAPEGAVAGGVGGGAIGGTIGLLAGIGALAIPGLGPFIAAGPLMATLSGAAAGAAVGGVAGGLIGLGVPEYEAKSYEGKIRNGNILIAVHIDNGAAEKRAKQIFEANNAHDIAVTGDASVPKKSEQVSRY